MVRRRAAGGHFWDSSDIVVWQGDDHYFLPSVSSLAGQVIDGRANYVYVEVEDLGTNATGTLRSRGRTLRLPKHYGRHAVIVGFVISEAECDHLDERVRGLNVRPCLLVIVAVVTEAK